MLEYTWGPVKAISSLSFSIVEKIRKECKDPTKKLTRRKFLNELPKLDNSTC